MDEAKAASNLASHGLSFDHAASFDFDNAMIEVDQRRNYGEKRLVATGRIGSRTHVLVYVKRNGTTRVISLRKANKREIARYERYLETSRS